MLDRVLLPVEFSEASMMMFDCAIELKELGMKHLTLLHVVPKGQSSPPEYEAKFKEMEKRLEEAGIDARPLILSGDPVEVILKEAEREDVDMIAMASGGKGRAEEFFVGSVSFAVLRRTKKPVLLDKFPMMEEGGVRRECRIGAQLFRHALVAVEIPMCSGDLEDLVATLCARGLKEATLLHVIDSSRYRMSDDDRFRETKKLLEEMSERLGRDGCKIQTHIHYGTAPYNILETAREIDASIIIVGTKQRSYLAGLTIGSVSEEVVRRADLPVLVVPC